MMEDNKVQAIKKLIKDGFDLDLISFELDIPIDELKQYSIETEQTRNEDSTRISKMIKGDSSNFKLQQIRERYRNLYSKSNVAKIEPRRDLTPEEIDLVNSVITTIEGMLKNVENASKRERRDICSAILKEYDKIDLLPLYIEHCEKLRILFKSKDLENISLSYEDKIDKYMDKKKKYLDEKLAEAIDDKQYQTDNLEELRELSKKITWDIANKNPITVGAVKTRIDNKITKITQQQLIDRIRNDIPENIEGILFNLANGQIDIEKAREIISEEAKKRVASKPKKRFSLTEEQEKNQIYIQIRTVLSEKSDKYFIKSPETTISQLQDLCQIQPEYAVASVVKNFVGRKDFETAKNVCAKFSTKNSEGETSKYMVGLKREIRNAEISDMILKGINMNGTVEEEAAYFELIEKGLSMGNIKLEAISLGKSKDGLKNIMLSDVWSDKKGR